MGRHCPGGVAQCIEGGNHKQRPPLNGCAGQVALTLQLVCFLACALPGVNPEYAERMAHSQTSD